MNVLSCMCFRGIALKHPLWLFALAVLLATSCHENKDAEKTKRITVAEIPDLSLEMMQPIVATAMRNALATVHSNPESDVAWGEFAMCLHAHNLPEAAVIAYAAAEQRRPDEFRWIYFGAIAQELAGVHFEQVVEKFDAAIAAGYEYGPVHIRKAQTLGRAGDLNASIKSYKHALTLYPDLAIAHRGIGQILLQMGKSKEAITSLERAYAASPDDRPTIAALAQCLTAMNRESERARELSKQLAHTTATILLPDPIYLELESKRKTLAFVRREATQARQSGEFERAKQLLSQLVEYEPKNVQALVDLGFVQFELGFTNEAEGIFKRALRIDETLPAAYTGIAQCRMTANQWNQAIEYLELAIGYAPEIWMNYLHKGRCLWKLGTKQEAREVIRRGITVSGHASTVYRQWGQVLLDCNDPTEARLSFQAAIELQPTNAASWLGLGNALEELGDVQGAMKAYLQSRQIDPTGQAAQRLRELSGGR